MVAEHGISCIYQSSQTMPLLSFVAYVHKVVQTSIRLCTLINMSIHIECCLATEEQFHNGSEHKTSAATLSPSLVSVLKQCTLTNRDRAHALPFHYTYSHNTSKCENFTAQENFSTL